jgi:ketosteroid isomerase-like protein
MSNNTDLVRQALEYTNGPTDLSDEELAMVFAPDVVLDLSTRVFNPKVYESYDGLREFRADALEVWEVLEISPKEIIEEGDRVLVITHVQSRGRGSGVPMEAEGAGIWTVADRRLKHYRLLQPGRATGVDREEALAVLRDPG